MAKIDLIANLNKANEKKHLTDTKVGDTVRVHTKIIEGNKERIQVFEGVVIGIKGGRGVNGAFTVRKVSYGIGVERVFPFHSSNIAKIEVKRRAEVRRAKLNYLKNLSGKRAKLKERQFDSLIVNAQPEVIAEDVKETEIEAQSEEQTVKAQKDDTTEEKQDEEVTEINPDDVEDEANVAEVSTEELAEGEVKDSNKAHEEEDEDTPADESNLPEEEVEIGIDKAEDQDTSKQG